MNLTKFSKVTLPVPSGSANFLAAAISSASPYSFLLQVRRPFHSIPWPYPYRPGRPARSRSNSRDWHMRVYRPVQVLPDTAGKLFPRPF